MIQPTGAQLTSVPSILRMTADEKITTAAAHHSSFEIKNPPQELELLALLVQQNVISAFRVELQNNKLMVVVEGGKIVPEPIHTVASSMERLSIQQAPASIIKVQALPANRESPESPNERKSIFDSLMVSLKAGDPDRVKRAATLSLSHLQQNQPSDHVAKKFIEEITKDVQFCYDNILLSSRQSTWAVACLEKYITSQTQAPEQFYSLYALPDLRKVFPPDAMSKWPEKLPDEVKALLPAWTRPDETYDKIRTNFLTSSVRPWLITEAVGWHPALWRLLQILVLGGAIHAFMHAFRPETDVYIARTPKELEDIMTDLKIPRKSQAEMSQIEFWRGIDDCLAIPLIPAPPGEYKGSQFTSNMPIDHQIFYEFYIRNFTRSNRNMEKNYQMRSSAFSLEVKSSELDKAKDYLKKLESYGIQYSFNTEHARVTVTIDLIPKCKQITV